MNEHLKAGIVVVFVSVTASIIAACGSAGASSTSAAGPTQPQFDALVAQVAGLATQVAALTTQSGALTAQSDDLSAQNSELTKAVTGIKKAINVVSTGPANSFAAALADDCAFIGYLGNAKPIYQASAIQCRSPTGYLFAIPAPSGGLPVGLSGQVYFEGAGCAGPAYAGTESVSNYGQRQGAVVTFDDADSRFNVGYISPTDSIRGVDIQSVMFNAICSVSVGPISNLLPLHPNDETVTGVSTTGYAGPIIIQ